MLSREGGICDSFQPPKHVGLLFARSGLAIKEGLGLVNGVGVIDSDYRGEVKVGGLCWSARAEDGRVIPVGTEVTVVEIRGVKLIVK